MVMNPNELGEKLGDPPTYYYQCPNGHLIETWVKGTKTCNQCRTLRGNLKKREKKFKRMKQP